MGIKKMLFKMLFPAFYKEYENLRDIVLSQRMRMSTYNNIKNADRYVKVFEAIQRDNAKVLGIEQNKDGEWVIVVKKMKGNDIWVQLYSPTYLAINNHPRIMSVTHKSEGSEYSAAKNYVYIEDVLMQDNSIGNGSICMEYFIEEVREQGFDYISGKLSSIDKENFKRSIPFYKKFGFEVTMRENNNGNIKLDFTKEGNESESI